MVFSQANSNLCIGINSGANWGDPIIQWGCYFGDNQHFTSSIQPSFGVIDTMVGTDVGFDIQGWTLAPNASSYQLGYQVLVGGSVVSSSLANTYRPDVGAAFPGYSDYRGYDLAVSVPLIAGVHTACVQSNSFGVFSTLGCGTYKWVQSNNGFLGIGDVCPMTKPTIGFYDEGVGSGGTVNFFPTAATAALRWSSKSTKVLFVQGSTNKPRVRVRSGKFGSGFTGDTSNSCAGPWGIGLVASSKVLRMNEQMLNNDINSTQALETAIHELGHALGLDHRNDPPSQTVMRSSGFSPVDLPNYPTVSDVQNVDSKY